MLLKLTICSLIVTNIEPCDWFCL